MFRVLTIAPDGRVEESTDRVAPPAEGELRWIDVQAQDAAQMAVLAKNFGFHPLAIEDCLQVGQRPKLEEYDDYIFLVTHALRCVLMDQVDLCERNLCRGRPFRMPR